MFVFPFPLSHDLLLHHRNIVYSNVLTMMVNGIVFYDIHQTHWLVTASVMHWLAHSPAYLEVNFSNQFKVGCLFFFDLHTLMSLMGGLSTICGGKTIKEACAAFAVTTSSMTMETATERKMRSWRLSAKHVCSLSDSVSVLNKCSQSLCA